MSDKNTNTKERPPVVAVMGHIDHGKSTLLDYIRKTNITDKEAGGITQHISAYEVIHKDEKGKEKKITFLDTPGHAAFSQMRIRGANLADIAILIVSAEDGVKPQTLEVFSAIQDAKIPFIVAINKIDRPEANIEKVKLELSEKGIYLEGYGGSVPYCLISAKEGTGIDDLLDLILISAEMEELSASEDNQPYGIVLESNLDPKRGITATIIIKDGVLKSGMSVVVEDTLASTRIMEDFMGNQVKQVSFSSPVRIVGFDKIPPVGAIVKGYNSKKDAQKSISEQNNNEETSIKRNIDEDQDRKIVPIIIKADTTGSLEAIEEEIKNLENEEIACKIISKGVGMINENDGKLALSDAETIVIGFNVKADTKIKELFNQHNISLEIFDIIYSLSEWLKDEMEKRRPRKDILEVGGSAKIERCFSRTKDRQVIGGKVTTGKISKGNTVRILRRDFEIGKGKIIELQQNKVPQTMVEEGSAFGMLLESKTEVAQGDRIEPFVIVKK